MIDRYKIHLTADYGEQWNTTIEREPDQPVTSFGCQVTERSTGRRFVGQLLVSFSAVTDPLGIGAAAVGTSAMGV